MSIQIDKYIEESEPYALRTVYVGVITYDNVITNVFVLDSKKECIEKIESVVKLSFNSNKDNAKIFEHSDLSNGEQEVVEVYSYYAYN
jgi:hypothetical protein